MESPPVVAEVRRHTLSQWLPLMPCAALGTRFRAITAPRKPSPAPRALVISNVGSFGGGGAVGFRDMVLAIREKRPDLEVVAVCPWKGSLAAEFARQGIRTKITFIPGWAFLERSRTPRIEALIGALPARRTSPLRHLASNVATCSTTPDSGAHQHDGHSRARDRCQTARHPALSGWSASSAETTISFSSCWATTGPSA